MKLVLCILAGLSFAGGVYSIAHDNLLAFMILMLVAMGVSVGGLSAK